MSSCDRCSKEYDAIRNVHIYFNPFYTESGDRVEYDLCFDCGEELREFIISKSEGENNNPLRGKTEKIAMLDTMTLWDDSTVSPHTVSPSVSGIGIGDFGDFA